MIFCENICVSVCTFSVMKFLQIRNYCVGCGTLAADLYLARMLRATIVAGGENSPVVVCDLHTHARR